jgi:hypothetical protein
MTIGLIETLLVERFGAPTVTRSDLGTEHSWNTSEESRECLLYKPLSWDDRQRREFAVLRPLYGDAMGGFLLGDSLKVSLLAGPEIFGLYQIADLQDRPEVRRALEFDPEVCFFMDAANVWYYGIKDGELYVYDAPFDELDSLGPVRRALEQLLTEFEEAAPQ